MSDLLLAAHTMRGPVEDTGGVLIMPDQIAAIEFRKLTEEAYEQ